MWNEIKSLREQGELQEAYRTAREQLTETSRSGDSNGFLWAKRAMGFVLYDYLKECISNLEESITRKEISKVIKVLDNIQKLKLPDGEDIFYEQFTWKVMQVLKLLNAEKSDHRSAAKKILSKIKTYFLSSYEDAYKYLLIQFHNALKEDAQYIEMVDWWNTDHFTDKDFEQRESKNGRNYPSLAEQIFTTYSKHLVAAVSEGSITTEKVEAHIRKLGDILEQHPEFKFLHYRRAQLQLALDKKEDAFSTFLPFARKNQRQPWVWELLGDLYDTDQELQIACYCQALLINTKEDFLNKIRIKLATLLINKQLWDEARTEIDFYYKFRTDQGWKVSNTVNSWMTMPWYSSASTHSNNKGFYKKRTKSVNKILYSDLPEELVVVYHVNKKKKLVSFIKSRSKEGFFNYSDFDLKPVEGETLKVRMIPKGNKGYHDAFSAEETDETPDADILREISGAVQIHKGNNFGFIDNVISVFVEPKLVAKHNLSHGDDVSGKAIASYDKRKKEWRWKLLPLIQLEDK